MWLKYDGRYVTAASGLLIKTSILFQVEQNQKLRIKEIGALSMRLFQMKQIRARRSSRE